MLSFRPVVIAKLLSVVIFCPQYIAHFLVKLSQCAIHQHLLTKVFLQNKKQKNRGENQCSRTPPTSVNILRSRYYQK